MTRQKVLSRERILRATRQGLAVPGGGLLARGEHGSPEKVAAVLNQYAEIVGPTLPIGAEGAPLYRRQEENTGKALPLLTFDPKRLHYVTKTGIRWGPRQSGTPAKETAGFWPADPEFDAKQEVWDFSFGGTLEIIQQSRKAVRCPIHTLLVHDLPDYLQLTGQEFEEVWRILDEGVFAALADLHRGGAVQRIGLGLKSLDVAVKVIQANPFAIGVVSQTCYTLVHHRTCLQRLMPLCLEHGIEVDLAGPFANGILSHDPRTRPDSEIHCNYRPATGEEIRKARMMWEIAEKEFGLPSLRPVALVFPYLNPRIRHVAHGPRNAADVRENMDYLLKPEPRVFECLAAFKKKGLIHPEAPIDPDATFDPEAKR